MAAATDTREDIAVRALRAIVQTERLVKQLEEHTSELRVLIERLHGEPDDA